MPTARSFAELPGGREAFDRAHAEIRPVAEAAQQRLADALDAIGAAGQWGWDPIKGELALRGRVFRAEPLGSFDGATWLWSWANDYLAIPQEKTTMARRLRAKGGVFAEPMIAASDETLPYMMGDFAVAYCGAEAYWVANGSQVCVFEPGQLVAPRLRRLASCFVSKALTLDAVRAHLDELGLWPAGDGVLEVERDGFVVRITRLERLGDVLREATLAAAAAKRYGSVLVVETSLDPSYVGTRYGVAMGTWAPQAVGDVGPVVNGPMVAAEALLCCERLNALPGALVWDLVLGCAYPKV